MKLFRIGIIIAMVLSGSFFHNQSDAKETIYDSDLGLAYANKYCKEYNTTQYESFNNDCANFMSQALIEGGITFSDCINSKDSIHSIKGDDAKCDKKQLIKGTDVISKDGAVKGVPVASDLALVLQGSYCFKLVDQSSAEEGDILVWNNKYLCGKHVGMVTDKTNKYYAAHTNDRCSGDKTCKDSKGNDIVCKYDTDATVLQFPKEKCKKCDQDQETCKAELIAKCNKAENCIPETGTCEPKCKSALGRCSPKVGYDVIMEMCLTGQGGDCPDETFTVGNGIAPQPASEVSRTAQIGILDSGFTYDAVSLLQSFNETARIVQIGDISPDMVKDMSLLIIPSGGLYGMEKSEFFRVALDEYVKQGGTIFVLSQQHGYEYSAIPGGLGGYGWLEDQSCQTNSSYIDTWHPVLAGQTRSTPSVNVDGYFTQYPENAIVLLRRASNGQAALLLYPYGSGYVIATSAYTDSAFTRGEALEDEKKLMRDIVTWAKYPASLPETRRGENITLDLPIQNTNDSFTSVGVDVVFHDPDGNFVRREAKQPLSLPPGEDTLFPVTYTIQQDAKLGIYQIKHELYTEDWILWPSEENPDGDSVWTDIYFNGSVKEPSGRFVVSNPPANPYKSPDFSFSATTNTERVPYGGNIVFTVHVWNNTDQQRTVIAKYVFPHMYLITKDPSYGVYKGSYQPGTDNEWITRTVTIGPSGETSFDHLMRNALHDEFIHANFYDENNKFVGVAHRGFFLFYPSVNVLVQTDKPIYAKGETVNLVVILQNTQDASYGAIVKARVTDPSNVIVYEGNFEKTLVPSGTSSQNLSFILPPNGQGGSYAVLAEAYDSNGNKIGETSAHFDLPLSKIAVTPNLPVAFTIEQNVVSFILTNTGKTNIYSGTLDIIVKDPDGTAVCSGTQTFSLSIGETKILDSIISIPGLKFGNYTLFYTQSDETRTGHSVAISIPNTIGASLAFDKPQYGARDQVHLGVTLVNKGKFSLDAITLTVAVPDISFTETRTASLSQGQTLTQQYLMQIPEAITPGEHIVNISTLLPSGNLQTQTGRLIIPESSLLVSLNQLSYNAGDTMVLSLRNNGGVTTTADFTVRLFDDSDFLVLETLRSESIKNGEEKNIDFTLPAGIKSGQYQLTIVCKNQRTGQETTLHKLLTINGAQVTLTTKTDKESYFSTDNIMALTTINNQGVSLNNSTLSLKVTPASSVVHQERWDSTWNGTQFQVDTISSPGDLLLSKHNVITNGDFETGNLTGWTRSGINGGNAYIAKEGTRFSSFPTEQIIMDGTYSINVRSSSPAPTDSWGILTSNSFVPVYSTIEWIQLSESPNVYLEYRVLDSSDTVLKSGSLPIVTTNWGNQGIDISEYIGQTIKIEFRQHTTQAGLGWFTLLDNIRNGSDVYYASGNLESETQDYGLPVDFKNIQWTATLPTNTSIKFQIATNNDNSIWNYMGPDGTPDTYYETSGAAINPIHNGNRYMRWKAYLTTPDINNSPILHSLTITVGETSERILWQNDIPVNIAGGTIQDINTPISLVNTQGKLYLLAELKSHLGQGISVSEYAFYIADDTAFVTFSSDKRTYKPGEMVTITGEVRNRTSTTIQRLSLILDQQSASGSQTLLFTDISLPPNGNYPFVTTIMTGAQGVYSLRAKVIQDTIVLSEMCDKYQVMALKVTPIVSIPDFVSNEPFTVSIQIKNESILPAVVNVQSTIDSQIRNITILGGQIEVLEYSQQITSDTIYTFTFTGDLEQTITKAVYYGLATNITINSQAIFPEGNVEVPVTLSNIGQLAENLSIDFNLSPGNLTQTKNFYLQPKASITDTLYFNLSEGEYQITASSQLPTAFAQANFSVLKQNKVEMTVSLGSQTNGLIPVNVNLTNLGYNTIEGSLRLSAIPLTGSGQAVWNGEEPISQLLSQNSQLITININPSGFSPGNYNLQVELVDNSNQPIAVRSLEFGVQSAIFQITQLPSYQIFNPGQEATFIFRVKNTGNQEGSFDLNFKAYDLINSTQREWLKPSEEKTLTYGFMLPEDLEEKDYFATYELNAQNSNLKGEIKYHLSGISLNVNASLDKPYYNEGETAHLTINIQSNNPNPQNLFARINYAGYEPQQTFTLDGSQTLSFDVPLPSITGEKLFYGIYYESGRSIHLNSLYIHKAGDVLTIETDKQVYNPGESVFVTVTGSASGNMTLSGPGNYTETFFFSGQVIKSFTLPAVISAGTYFINVQLTTLNSELITNVHPFDVAGIQVKVLECQNDKGKYASTDAITTNFTISSNTATPALLKGWIVDPKGQYTSVGEQSIDLSSSENSLVTYYSSLITEVSGIHRLVYGIYGSGDLLLCSGSEAFDVGDAVLLGISTDKKDYPTNTEPVIVTASLFGSMDAELQIELDGTLVKSESISLNGYTTYTTELQTITPSPHILKATLTAGGLTSTKEASFTYALAYMPKPQISASAYYLDFGSINLGSTSAQTITLSSTGNADLVIGTIALSGTNQGEFSIQSDSCSGGTITPSGTCTLEILFSPVSIGEKSASLSIPSNATEMPTLYLPLDGTGITTLNIAINPDGSGRVTGTGIDCPGDCTESFATEGASIELTAVPMECYQFTNWTGDINLAENPVAVNMDTHKNVTANFAIKTFTITATASLGGDISPSGAVTVNCGASQAFSILPSVCYYVADVKVDGISVGAVLSYTFDDVTSDHTIEAIFAINQYTITATAGENGAIFPAGTIAVDCGASQTFTMTPDTGYHILDVKVEGVSVGPVTSYIFNNVTSNHTIEVTFESDNISPSANAGLDQNVITGQVVTLDGSESFDPEGAMITFLWTFVEVPVGSLVSDSSLSDATSAKPKFLPDVDGIYRVQLMVNDGALSSVPDEVVIHAATPNVAPNANAGPDQNAFTGNVVQLDGSRSSDPDNGPGPLSYLWSFVVKPTGSLLTDNDIVNRNIPGASFIPDVDGIYELKLAVSDGDLSSEDTVLIMSTLSNVPPNANAGADVTINLEDTAVLNGSTSNDPDNGPQSLTYLWRFVAVPTGSQLTNGHISGANTESPSFTPDVLGTYVLELMVFDGRDVGFDNVAVTVINSPPNPAPAGGGVCEINSQFLLKGQISDYNGDLVEYEWSEGNTLLFEGSIQTIFGGTPVNLPEHSYQCAVVGGHTIDLSASDRINPPAAASININVIDITAPTLSPVPDKSILWPPNHDMVTVTIQTNARDNSGGPVTLSAVVSSNEPQDGLGDGDMSPDWTEPVIDQVNGIITLQLRAERSGGGSGRIYTIMIEAEDAYGNSSQAQVEIIVPHDKGKK